MTSNHETRNFLISSKLVFFTDKNELISENLDTLKVLIDNNINIAIVATNKYNALSSMKTQLEKECPEYLDSIMFIHRQASNVKEFIDYLKDHKIHFAMLGIIEEDAHIAFNNKIPLLKPEGIPELNQQLNEKIQKYGIPFNDFSDIIDCFKVFEIHKNNYFHWEDDRNFSVISLFNANSMYTPQKEKNIKQFFQNVLKGSGDNIEYKTYLILSFFLLNEVTTNNMFTDVKYWGTFPSSNKNNKETAVSSLKETIRTVVKGLPRATPPNEAKNILIRHTDREKKHHSSTTTRRQDKCQSDFDTLIVNPGLVDKIRGKEVCIIDDYITKGYSAEATKHLLLAAGASKVIFLSLGKFGSEYFTTEYEIEGDLKKPGYYYNFINESSINQHGQYFDRTNKTEIIELYELIESL